MSLRSRITSLLIGLSIALALTMYVIQTLVVMPTFVELERTGAERDMNRCIDALQRELEAISNMARDWASWDDSYQYVVDHNDRFRIANLVDESFSNANLNLICFVDNQGQVVWGEVRDVETMEKIDVPDLFAAIQQVASPITTHDSIDHTLKGIIMTREGPMLFASLPIITTKHQGPIRGALIMGRFFSPSEVDNLANRTHVNLTVWRVGQADMPADAQQVIAEYSNLHKTYVETVDEKTLYAYRVVDDVYGKPALLLRLDVPRVVTAQGRLATHTAVLSSVAGAGLTLFVLWIVLQRGVVNPLRQLAAHTVRMGQTGDLKSRLNLKRTDEIGTLANEFDQMVKNLAAYRREILDTAHQSGMEEVAAEVLHNVGNAMNSASCSAETLRLQLEDSKVAGFERAAELLQRHAPHAGEFFGADPQGAKLIDYLVSLNHALQQEHASEQREVARLFDTIRHIRDIIAAQQSYTGKSEYRQEVTLSSLVDEALLLNQGQLDAHHIKVDVDLPPLPELHLNKSKLTQVLVNLVRNAVEAMREQVLGTRRLRISARVIDETGLEIEVQDTGCGFDNEVRDKVFAHGFTTKPNGNGFGLHYCANAVQGAGGQIVAESPGPGLGATFRVRLVNVMPALAATL